MSSARPSLAIVIHTEEEFDWNGGFFRSNNQVTHGKKLTEFCEKLIAVGAKITFALDYAFVDSTEGQKVIAYFKEHHYNQVEFATHLHPWVNPPFTENNGGKDEVDNDKSYPGNLIKELEYQKLKALTEKITDLCDTPPKTYLAGRYGIGDNTNDILQKLGYKIDVSISPFTDFSHQQGPDFSAFNNDVTIKNGVINWPHTTAILSALGLITKYFNKEPSKFEQWQKRPFSKLLMKLLRVKRQRLSPEGFALSDLKKITNTQLTLGQESFIFSFHSPSVQAGLTPYVKTPAEEAAFFQTTLDYINWFQQSCNGQTTLIKENSMEECRHV